jgi:hypothetical protein
MIRVKTIGQMLPFKNGTALPSPSPAPWLCAGHGTRLKGEPIISNYGSQGKSQAQPDGGEGHSVITTGYPVTVLRKAVAPLRRSSTKARGDEQKSS